MKDKAASARSPSRQRRRRRSRSRRRDKKKERGKANPVVKPKKEEILAADPEAGEEFETLEEEEEEDPEAGRGSGGWLQDRLYIYSIIYTYIYQDLQSDLFGVCK